MGSSPHYDQTRREPIDPAISDVWFKARTYLRRLSETSQGARGQVFGKVDLPILLDGWLDAF